MLEPRVDFGQSLIDAPGFTITAIVDSRSVEKGRKVLLMRSKMIYRRLLKRCKASRMKKKRVALELAKLKAETNRISKLQREVKQDLEQIAFQIAKKREENRLLLEYDARMRRGVDLVLDILDAQDQRDLVKPNNFT